MVKLTMTNLMFSFLFSFFHLNSLLHEKYLCTLLSCTFNFKVECLEDTNYLNLSDMSKKSVFSKKFLDKVFFFLK